MNNIKRIVFAMTLFVMLPLVAFADCQSDFDAIANQFKFSYKYNEETDDFTITIINPDYKRYSIYYGRKEDLDNAKRGVTNSRLVVTLNNYKSDTYTYGFVAIYGGCQGVAVKQETVSLKKYNPYADNPKCEGYEEFALCQKEYDKEIDEETFESRLKSYKESNGKSGPNDTTNNGIESDENTSPDINTTDNQNDEKKTDENKTKSQNIIKTTTDYIEDHTIEVIVAATLIIALIIGTIIFIRISIKRRRLE